MVSRYRTKILLILVAIVLAGSAHRGRAGDLPPPTIRTFAGAFLIDDRSTHNFFVESELNLPLFRVGPATVSYRYRESTPFLDLPGSIQGELLYTLYEIHVDFQLAEHLQVLTVGGYQSTHLIDRAGFLGSYSLGAGLGSGPAGPDDRLEWSAVAGGYLSPVGPSPVRTATGGLAPWGGLSGPVSSSLNWWGNLHAAWRLTDWKPLTLEDSQVSPALLLAGDLESANDSAHLQPFSRVGPALRLLSGNGNQLDLSLQWYYNDHNPFYELSDNGLMVGANVTSVRDDDTVFDARDHRRSGWLPLIWGGQDAGIWDNRRVTKFNMSVEMVDIPVADYRVTPFIWYESREEYRFGDFDNISYSVSLGLQSPIGLESPLSHGDPLVVGLDFLHRSDHSLNPNADRTAVVGSPRTIDGVSQNLIPHGSLNLFPRARLQTLGWDLPYRDPSIYERKTDWLGTIDWRVTAANNLSSSRNRGQFAGQLGLNCDLATVQGYVVYLRGEGSIGNEDPDWLAEVGVRRPLGYIFTRWERYGLNANLARGDALLVGVGVNL